MLDQQKCNKLEVPVIFLLYKRPNTTQEVFKKISEARPRKLYIAADGPKVNATNDERENIRRTREFVLNNINWDCEVHTLFQENNLGCRAAVSTAIDWFFEHEEQGIILEDDCLPASSFFIYCQKLLTKYKDDTRIMHISGDAPLDLKENKESYYFSPIQHCWGWATWRRAWKCYDHTMATYPAFKKSGLITSVFRKKSQQLYWLDMWDKASTNDEPWDFVWTYSIIAQGGLCITPTKNLVQNIGFGPEATHSKKPLEGVSNREASELSEIVHPTPVRTNQEYLERILRIRFQISCLTPLVIAVSRLKRKLKSHQIFK